MLVATTRAIRLSAFILLTAGGALRVTQHAALADVPVCAANAITVTIDASGQFAGMSHNGVLVRLRNDSLDACTLAVFPRMTMRDANGVTIATVMQSAGGQTSPGTAVARVVVQSGDAVSAQLQWVGDNVYAAGRTATATGLSIPVDDRTITAPMSATIWGRQGESLGFSAQPFTGTAAAVAGSNPVSGAATPQKPACAASDIRFTFKLSGESPNRGALVTLRNAGTASCTVPAFPALTLRGADGATVATPVSAFAVGSRAVSHLAVFPAELATGDVSEGLITWTDTNVIGANAQSLTVTAIVLQVGDQMLSIPLHTTVWSVTGKPATFREAPFGRPAPGGL